MLCHFHIIRTGLDENQFDVLFGYTVSVCMAWTHSMFSQNSEKAKQKKYKLRYTLRQRLGEPKKKNRLKLKFIIYGIIRYFQYMLTLSYTRIYIYIVIHMAYSQANTQTNTLTQTHTHTQTKKMKHLFERKRGCQRLRLLEFCKRKGIHTFVDILSVDNRVKLAKRQFLIGRIIIFFLVFFFCFVFSLSLSFIE